MVPAIRILPLDVLVKAPHPKHQKGKGSDLEIYRK